MELLEPNMAALRRGEPVLVNSRCGAPTLRVVAADGCEKLLHSGYEPMKEARCLVDRFTFDGRGIIVVLGLGLGYHVKELAARFPEAEIIVIEALPECERLARKHETIDFNRGRLDCLNGLSPAAALQRVTERQLQAGMPPLSLFSLPAAVAAFPAYYQPLRDTLGASVDLNLAGRLRQRKFRETSARILLFDSGYFLTREVAAALRQLGHHVERLHFTPQTPLSELLAGLVTGIASFHPDFCLTINHLGFDEEGGVTQFLSSIEMPAASWFVDSPDLIVRGFDRNVSPFTALFVWDTAYIASMRQAGFEAVSYLPLATAPELFRPLPADVPDVARLAATVGFIGNSMVAPLADKLAKIPRHLHAVTEKLARRLGEQRTSLGELFATLDLTEKRQLDQLGSRERIDLEKAVTWQATLLYRRDCIEQLRAFRPVIRGDQGWRSLLDADFTLSPPLDYYRELPLFYNACTVNFNATNLQMGTAVNQRLFDVPASGGFLLTDHQESLEDLFAVGEEVITYRDRAEIPGLVRFYLDNSGAREKVARRGRERVLRQHTYRHRLETLITAMKNRYS
jgi:spore maturation protein CgeB